MSAEHTEIYQLYIDEKGFKPKIPRHLTAFAKTKGLKIRFVDARNIIANPPDVTSSLNTNGSSTPNNAPNTASSVQKCTDCQRRKKGKIYDDGSFYCLECWDMYDDDDSYNTSDSNNTHSRLTALYDDYVAKRDETPSNTYDLINHLQYKGVHNIAPKEIGQFMMNLKPNGNRDRAPTVHVSPIIDNTKCSIPSRSRAMTDISPYKSDCVRELYQIYYKSKGMKPRSPQQLSKYGESINIPTKWNEVNKFMKNSEYYLASLITPHALQTVVIPKMHKAHTITIKVEATDSEYYEVKGLSLNSTVDDVCKKLEFRLQESSTKINLYKDDEPLPRHQKLKDLGLHHGDTVSLGVHNTSIGMDSFLQTSAAKKKYYQQFQSLSHLANQSNKKVQSLMNEYDEKTADVMDVYTNGILGHQATGNVTNRDTLLHVMSGLAESKGQKCIFFNSKENIMPQDAVEHNSHLHIVEANSDKGKTFVLTLDSLNNAEEKSDQNTEVTDEGIYEMQKCIEANKTESHPLLNDLKWKLSQVHDVVASRIQITGVFIGSFNVEYTISDLTTGEIETMRNNAGELQDKMDTLFDGYQRLNIHPILFRQTYDISMFDEAGNKTFDTKDTYQVGKDINGQCGTYTQPYRWTRYGLSVLNKYEDNTWLEPFQDDKNWYRAYHGTNAVDAMSSIYNGGFHLSYRDGTNGTTAIYGDGVYVSPNPEFVERYYASIVSVDTKSGLKNFKFMLMVAVKPDSVIKDSADIWHIPHAKDVRPYGILIKEC
eukprot:238638_1